MNLIKRFTRCKTAFFMGACWAMGWPGWTQDVSWAPREPAPDDVVTITISGCTQGAVLHWGVNAKAHAWQTPLPAYRPAGSVPWDAAIRSAFAGPDTQGVCRLELGPFNHTNQPVISLDFAIMWADGSWDNNHGEDFKINFFNRQIVSHPVRPTLNDRIIIQVKKSKEGGLLRWGVNAQHGQWREPSFVYWPAGTVPAEDGLAVDSALPAPDESGTSTLVLGPFNQGAQVVTSLHMAVHWGDHWESDFGRNYNVYFQPPPEAEFLSILEPAEHALFQGLTGVPVRIRTAGPVTLWVDGKERHNLAKEPYEAMLEAEHLGWGEHFVTARTGSGTNIALATANFWLAPVFERNTPEPAYPWGAHALESNRVSFVLHAPGKHFVSVLGDFNHWDPSAHPMNCSSNGTWWTVIDLPAGRHLYQYGIDGLQRLADPCAPDVEWQDEAGRETYKPELARGVIEVGQEPYAWQDAAWRRPSLNQLLVYEFFIHDFCPGQGFTGVLARLDYLQDLGVNAIEPLPFTEFAGAWSWGYNPSFYFAPETTFGTPADLKRLVDEAHRRGLAVVMDAVFNHTDWNASLFQLYGIDYQSSPYFWLFTGDNWGFPDIDQTNAAVKNFQSQVLAHWINDYHLDGFRYDATRWVGWQGYNDWGASWFAYAAKQADSGTYQIAEHLPPDPELPRQTEMDTGWDSEFRWRMRDMLRNARLDAGVFVQVMQPAKSGYAQATDRMAYTESHDEERVMHELLEAGYALPEAAQRCISALALTLTAPGAAMIFAGQEFGEDARKTLDPNPLHWERTQQEPYQDIYEAARALCRLRTTHPALAVDHLEILHCSSDQQTVVYVRGNGAQAVLVAVNFDRQRRLVNLPGREQQRWLPVVGARPVTTREHQWAFDLPPGGCVVMATAP